MISFLGYAAVALIVAFVLFRLWALRKIIVYLLILGGLTFVVTNYILRNADMSEKNVKSTTHKIFKISKTTIKKIMKKNDEFQRNYAEIKQRDELAKKPKPSIVPEIKPEPEGFVTK